MTSNGIKIIMGGTGILRNNPCPQLPTLLQTIKSHQVTHIDTAVIYGASETVLGEHNAGSQITLDTKIPGGLVPGTCTHSGVIRTARESLTRLKVPSVDVLYIHSPDESVAFEDTLAAMNELYADGVYRRFGLSNFTADQVLRVFRICGDRGWVTPSVYQGNYNPFARSYEERLIPLLREYGVSFYAYSPQAGGFLGKTYDQLTGGKEGEGRLLGNVHASDLYKALYKKPSLLRGLKTWNEIADAAGLRPGDMAMRWVRFNSVLKAEFGDAVIVGGRTVEQVEETLTVLEQGPLDGDVVESIDRLWDVVKGEAPVDNYHDFVKLTLEQK